MKQREKVFGPGQAVPLDRNAKVRVMAHAKGWTALHRQPRQHKGPITRAFMEVLAALLWGFHNSRSGCCIPSYEAIAAKAGCHRDTVAEALKVLELAGILTWQHRIVRVRERCRDLFGADGWRWRVVRTSNAYAFRDPKASKPENPPGTLNQEFLPSSQAAAAAAKPLSGGLLEALGRLAASVGLDRGRLEPEEGLRSGTATG